VEDDNAYNDEFIPFIDDVDELLFNNESFLVHVSNVDIPSSMSSWFGSWNYNCRRIRECKAWRCKKVRSYKRWALRSAFYQGVGRL
jgi:hypothetical protein